MSPFSLPGVSHSTLPASPSGKAGGDDGIRTHDPLLAGQVLSQLSYTPASCDPLGSPLRGVGAVLFSQAVSSQVSSALRSLTSVFGMGTGGPCALLTPTSLLPLVIQN